MTLENVRRCFDCKGTGRRKGRVCSACGGKGYVPL